MSQDKPRPWRRLKWLLPLVAALLLARVAVSLRSSPDPGTPAEPVAARADAADRPSIVLISLDTLRPDHLSFNGYPKPTSPSLDHFAASAIRFDHAYCQSPWTLLSHMSLFTSMLPSHNGVDTMASVLPQDVPTLAELLRERGYHTAALVNNAQMRARWGFDRGFDLWREYQEGPAGNCVRITDAALSWLASRPPRPFFLFLHYFDPHSPYIRPEPYASAMGSTLSPIEIYRFLAAHRFPGSGPIDPAYLQQIRAAYDGSIAWMDAELGRLIAALPDDAVVVFFSDHGEAFREHGWFAHGSTLYEEEMRVLLMMRLPNDRGGRSVEQPVMLMDVAPTLLAMAGAAPLPHFEGTDLAPALRGEPLPQRPIPLETRLPIQRSVWMGLVDQGWKALASPLDGSRELYRLPDETLNLADEAVETGGPLFSMLEAWAAERDYWVLYARGPSTYRVAIEASEGVFTAVVPSDISPHGQADLREGPRSVVWTPLPGEQVKMLHLQLSHPAAPLRLELQVDGTAAPQRLFLGSSRASPVGLPVQTDLAEETLRPLIDQPATFDGDGVLAVRYRGSSASSKPANVEALNEATLEQLRSLGYLR